VQIEIGRQAIDLVASWILWHILHDPWAASLFTTACVHTAIEEMSVMFPRAALSPKKDKNEKEVFLTFSTMSVSLLTEVIDGAFMLTLIHQRWHS
jgi:hypothetical protein